MLFYIFGALLIWVIPEDPICPYMVANFKNPISVISIVISQNFKRSACTKDDGIIIITTTIIMIMTVLIKFCFLKKTACISLWGVCIKLWILLRKIFRKYFSFDCSETSVDRVFFKYGNRDFYINKLKTFLISASLIQFLLIIIFRYLLYKFKHFWKGWRIYLVELNGCLQRTIYWLTLFIFR